MNSVTGIYGYYFARVLAEKVGVTRQTVYAIEKNKYSPSLEVAFRIAQVFKVSLDEVFQYTKGE